MAGPKEQKQTENLQFFPWGPSTTACRQQMEKHHCIQAQLLCPPTTLTKTLRCCQLNYEANPLLPLHIQGTASLALAPAALLLWPPA